MATYEHAELTATYYGGREDRWETQAVLPGGEGRSFGNERHLSALNALGAEGWELVQMERRFLPVVGTNRPPETNFNFWLKRQSSDS